jgi:hypothetical protein
MRGMSPSTRREGCSSFFHLPKLPKTVIRQILKPQTNRYITLEADLRVMAVIESEEMTDVNCNPSAVQEQRQPDCSEGGKGAEPIMSPRKIAEVEHEPAVRSLILDNIIPCK